MKVPYVISGNMAYRALFTKTEKTRHTFTFDDPKIRAYLDDLRTKVSPQKQKPTP